MIVAEQWLVQTPCADTLWLARLLGVACWVWRGWHVVREGVHDSLHDVDNPWLSFVTERATVVTIKQR